MAAGIMLDRFRPLPVWGQVLLFLTAGLILLWARNRARWTAVPAVLGIGLAAGAVGGLRHHVSFWRISRSHLLNYVDNSTEIVRLRGTVLTPPIISSPMQDDYGLASRSRRQTRLLLEAGQVQTTDDWASCEGLVRLYVPGVRDDLLAGDEVEVLAKVRLNSGPSNPGEFDWRLYQRRSGVHLTAFASENEAVAVQRHAAMGAGISGLLATFRQRCRRVLLDNVDPQAEESGLLAAYIAGHNWSVSRSIDEAFRKSGTAHILAVSGSHVVMIGAFGVFLGMLLLHQPRKAAMVGLGAVLLFGLIVEPNPPALRAVIIAMLASGAILMRRPFSGPNWLAGSLFVLLLAGPTDLFNAGFQLSFLL